MVKALEMISKLWQKIWHLQHGYLEIGVECYFISVSDNEHSAIIAQSKINLSMASQETETLPFILNVSRFF